MRLSRWGSVWLLLLIVAGCDNGAKENRNTLATATTAASTTMTTEDGDRCQVPEPQESGEGTMTVAVYFFCDMSSFPRREELYALPRSIPTTETVLRTTLEELLDGPTPEEIERGFEPFLPLGREWVIDASITNDGVAIVDFTNELADLGNLSATSPAEAVRLTLEATVRQFPTIKDVVYRFEGDRMAWCNLFEVSCTGRSTYSD